MIFKKYTINYEIDLNKNTIFIFSIFNENQSEMKRETFNISGKLLG